MSIVKKTICSLLCLAALSFAGAASAAIIDTVEKNPDVLITFTTPNVPYVFTHDITDDGFVFNTATSASISVRLTDTNAGENYRIVLGDQVFIGNAVENQTVNELTGGTFVPIVLSAVSLADLNADGKINLTISSTNGSFYFAGSTLTAEVPEPATVGLLGLGLMGFAAARRKSAKSKNA